MAHIFAYLRDPLNSDTRDMAVDGSVTPVKYRYTAPADGAYLERALIFVVDTGAFDATAFGNGITMTNGLTLALVDGSDNVKTDLLDGETIKTNGDLSGVCFDVNHLTMGTGPETLASRWTFSKSGAPLALLPGDSLLLTVSDDLAGLDFFSVQVQGTTREDLVWPLTS